jgi:HK97 family phage major capsid protein
MPLLGKVKYFTGRDASTNIPVWSPSIAVPSNYAEGATSVGSDSTAVLGVTSITPYAYISVLPISNEALLLTGSNLEAELPSIFAEAFSKAIHAGILTGGGTGRNMTGLFTASVIPSGNLVACDAAGAPKMADLIELALKVQDFYDNGVIVMNPAIYSAVMADTTDGIDVYKQELARGKTIEGVQVVLTSYAPSATTADAIVAVAGNFADYAVGVAGQLEITPMKKVGENLTYFQAVSYFNGKPVLADNFFGLKAISGA